MDTTPETPAPKLDPCTVMSALGYPSRWEILTLLAKGKPMSVTELATAINIIPDLVSKHLKVMANAGIVVIQRDTGKDGRRQLAAVPAQFLVGPAAIDFGFCLLRFG